MRPRLAQLHQSGATNGQVPVWNNTTGLWEPGTASSSGIAATLLDAKGDLIVASANDTPARFAVGSDGQYLQADSTQTLGVKWATLTALTDPTTTKGDLITRTSSTLTRRAVGTNGQVLTADSAETDGVKWAAPAAGSTSPLVHANRVSGNVTVSSTSFAAVDSGLDLTVAAVTGDKLLLGVGYLWGNESSVVGEARFVTRAGGVNVTNIPNTTSGIGALACQISGQYVPVAAVVGYTVQSGDLSGGNVIIRLEARVNTASRTIWANGNYGLFVSALNTKQ